MPPWLPPLAIRSQLPSSEVWRWFASSLRRSLPRRAAAAGRVDRSRRFDDLGRAMDRAQVAELDVRIPGVLARLEAGDELPSDPALLVVAALSAGAGSAATDPLLRAAWPGLARAEGRLRAPIPRQSELDDLHALALAGLALEDARALTWRRQLLPRYWDALAGATLEDGLPTDRSPAALGRVLRDALLARTLWRAAGFVSPADPTGQLRRMTRALARLSRPGLGTHRFGPDSALGGEECSAILALAGHILGDPPPAPDGPWALPASGYYGFADDSVGLRLAVTAGRVAPERLPRHEHADLFSWELDVGGRPLVADPGSGAPGPMAEYARTTRAHSTITVDDSEQMELIPGGWTGRPPEVLEVSVGPDVNRLEFSGLARLGGAWLHARSIVATARQVEVRDRVEGAAGRVVRSLVHFAPHVRLQGVGRVLEARAGSRRLEIEPLGVSRIDVVVAERRRPSQGWWFDDHGNATPAAVLVLEASQYDGREFGCVLRWRD